MRIFKFIVAVLTILAGIVFLFNISSDIQFGFALVLIATGCLGLPEGYRS